MSSTDKNSRKYWVVFFVLSLALYCGFCLRFVIVKPPIQFDELVGLPAQNAITEWYETTSRVPGHPIDLNSVFYALSHPLDPFRFHPGVGLDGLGGRGSLMLSFGPYVAIFRDDERGVIFVWDDSAD